MADALGPTQVLLGYGKDNEPIAWDWLRDPNMLVGAAAGWGKTATTQVLMRRIAPATREGMEGGFIVWNPKGIGYHSWGPYLDHPEWESGSRLTGIGELWKQSFSPYIWDIHDRRHAEIKRREAEGTGIDEFRGAGFAPFVVVLEELQGMFQHLEKQEIEDPKAPKWANWIAADLNEMTALFRFDGIRFLILSQSMTAEGGIPTKTKVNCTAKLGLGPIDDGAYKATFGQNKPEKFNEEYRPVLGSGVFQCPHLGTRVVQVSID